MHSLRRQILLKSFKLFDLLIMSLSFLLASWVSWQQYGTVSFSAFLDMRFKIKKFAIFLILVVVWHFIFSFFELYHSRRLSSRLEEVRGVIKAATLGTFIVFLAGFIFHIRIITVPFLLTFWGQAAESRS